MKANNKMILAGLLGLTLPAHAYALQVSKEKVTEIGRRHNIQNLPADAANIGLIVETDVEDVYTINPTAFKKLRSDAIQEEDLRTIELLRDLVGGASSINRVNAADHEAGSQDIGSGTVGTIGE